ncbi:hypothetical protein LTR87_015697 [Friedmanniomyces endolithicus]|nr:hypothetical protein LTR87_015697 [Friedmanniomyces endolithicus]
MRSRKEAHLLVEYDEMIDIPPMSQPEAVNLVEKRLDRDMGDHRRDAEATHPILKTWQISFDYVRERRRTAAKLLSMMSFCDRQAIPASLLRIKEDGGEYNGEQHPDDTFEDDIEMLLGLSFISLSADGSAFDMHRLALVATRRWLKNRGNQEEQVKRLLAKLDAVFPLGQARELGHGSKLVCPRKVGITWAIPLVHPA